MNQNHAQLRRAALGLKLYWLIEQHVPPERANLFGTDPDERYDHAVCNALADILRDTRIIYVWRGYKLGKDHPATNEARAWHEAASALQNLVDSQKRDPETKRDFPDVDLPEFELAPSWVYLSAAK
jgi:hypothetical protein